MSLLGIKLLAPIRDHLEESGIFLCMVHASLSETLEVGGVGGVLTFRSFSEADACRIFVTRSPQKRYLRHLFQWAIKSFHLSDRSLRSRKCHSKKDFLVCWGETKSSKFPLNWLYFCTLSLPPLSVFSVNRNFIRDLENSLEREFSQDLKSEEFCTKLDSLKQHTKVCCCWVLGTVPRTHTHRALYFGNKSNICLNMGNL